MNEKGLDIILFTSYQNICYYSEYLYTDFGREYGLIVTPERHVTISANIDGGMPWRRSWKDNIVYTDWKRDNFFYAIDTILKAHYQKGRRIGIEHDQVTLELKHKLDNYFDDYEFFDVSPDVMYF